MTSPVEASSCRASDPRPAPHLHLSHHLHDSCYQHSQLCQNSSFPSSTSTPTQGVSRFLSLQVPSCHRHRGLYRSSRHQRSIALLSAARPPAFPQAVLLFHRHSFLIGNACASSFAAHSSYRVGATVSSLPTLLVSSQLLPTPLAPKCRSAAWVLPHIRFSLASFLQVKQFPRNRAGNALASASASPPPSTFQRLQAASRQSASPL